MTDYDEIRTCCTGAAICKRCWGYIAAAVTVLDKSLRGKPLDRHCSNQQTSLVSNISSGSTLVVEVFIVGFPIPWQST